MPRDWGLFQVAGILRSVGYQTTTSSNGNPSGTVTGWGINLNGWYNTFGKDRIVGQIVYGHAIASYMNDGVVVTTVSPRWSASVAPRRQVALDHTAGLSSLRQLQMALFSLFVLAKRQGTVSLNGSGFAGPDWSVRVSLANLAEAAYEKIGGELRALLDHVVEQWQASRAKPSRPRT